MDFIKEKHKLKIAAQCKKVGDCILWSGYKDKDGYGIINIKRINRKVHRVVYFINNGDIPDGMFVCHKCDNPSCINPDHLFLGTPNDNVQDMINKGRYVKGGKPHPGEKNGRAKIKESDVFDILNSNEKYIHLAEKYGVHISQIQRIKSKKAWKCLWTKQNEQKNNRNRA